MSINNSGVLPEVGGVYNIYKKDCGVLKKTLGVVVGKNDDSSYRGYIVGGRAIIADKSSFLSQKKIRSEERKEVVWDFSGESGDYRLCQKTGLSYKEDDNLFEPFFFDKYNPNKLSDNKRFGYMAWFVLAFVSFSAIIYAIIAFSNIGVKSPTLEFIYGGMMTIICSITLSFFLMSFMFCLFVGNINRILVVLWLGILTKNEISATESIGRKEKNQAYTSIFSAILVIAVGGVVYVRCGYLLALSFLVVQFPFIVLGIRIGGMRPILKLINSFLPIKNLEFDDKFTFNCPYGWATVDGCGVVIDDICLDGEKKRDMIYGYIIKKPAKYDKFGDIIEAAVTERTSWNIFAASSDFYTIHNALRNKTRDEFLAEHSDRYASCASDSESRNLICAPCAMKLIFRRLI